MIHYGHGSHVGRRRQHNEDTYLADAGLGLWLVADGMGGHAHGEVASALARDAVQSAIESGLDLDKSIRSAAERIIRQSRSNGEQGLPMGTTIAAVRADDESFQAAWVGDSRIYRWDGHTLQQISRDHSYVQHLVQQGTLTPGEEIGLALLLETGEAYVGEGTLASPGTSVSTTTGTTQMRIQFDNPDQVILPGQFLRVEVTLGTTQAVLVPQRATSRATDGALTAFVAVDDVAVQRRLTTQGSYNNAWIVTGGVTAGELLVVDGLTNLSDGKAVSTVPVTISEDGVVSDVGTGSDAAPAAGQER